MLWRLPPERPTNEKTATVRVVLAFHGFPLHQGPRQIEENAEPVVKGEQGVIIWEVRDSNEPNVRQKRYLAYSEAEAQAQAATDWSFWLDSPSLSFGDSISPPLSSCLFFGNCEKSSSSISVVIAECINFTKLAQRQPRRT